MTNKTKICYILPYYDPAASSHFFHLYELLERTARDLDILLIIEKAQVPPSGFQLRAYRQRFSSPLIRMAELIFVIGRERLSGTRFFYTHYSFFGGLAVCVVAKFFGGVNYYWNAGMPWLYRRSRIEEAVFRFILRHSILVTGTPCLAEEYRKHYTLRADHIRVMPNWIQIERFKNMIGRQTVRRTFGIADNAKVVLFVHRLSRRKGAHYILPVARAVTKEMRDAIFLVVGTGPEFRNLQLKNTVRLIGEVPNSKIPDYFAAANVFFMPSEEEGFPHVLLEAMAAGVPYVASDVGGVREITPPDLREYVLPEGDVGAFPEKIIKLLTMAEEGREKIIRVEKEWVKRYDISAAEIKFLALFS